VEQCLRTPRQDKAAILGGGLDAASYGIPHLFPGSGKEENGVEVSDKVRALFGLRKEENALILALFLFLFLEIEGSLDQVFFMLVVDNPLEHDLLGHNRAGTMPCANTMESCCPVLQ